MISRPLPAPPRTLGDLARVLDAVPSAEVDPVAVIAGLADDSRAVAPGDVFFARRGSTRDGAAFARDAVGRGAVAVVAEEDVPGLPVLRVADASAALRLAADAWYGLPQQALDLIAVTGTKGKTTTAWLTAAALRNAGRRTALLGTIAHDLGDGRLVPTENTTPGPLELRRLLALARDGGATAAVMEVSSHALHQGRTEGLPFRVAVFTNLASDHLDYHRTPEAYYEAKSLLFRNLPAGATAVLNREDPAWPRLAALCRGPVLTYGFGTEADLRADRLVLTTLESRFRMQVAEGEVDVASRLVGRHNVLNFLAAVAAAAGVGIDPVVGAAGASRLDGVRGRLERVEPSGDLHVFVDYAHTEDALRQVLGFLAQVGARPLTVVVGCGGDRDRTKRPRMARVAAELADHAVFTSDNPRTEDPNAILAEMKEGLPAELLAKTTTVVDRRDAIRHAIVNAAPGASVLVAGKGHEDYQVLGTRKVPFDDVGEVRRALRRRALGNEAESPVRDQAWGAPRA
jgi:UDP-N-acetylmuramoyl-L-alanyl-D-glutamate--2,6-diaminopimelate ligase